MAVGLHHNSLLYRLLQVSIGALCMGFSPTAFPHSRGSSGGRLLPSQQVLAAGVAGLAPQGFRDGWFYRVSGTMCVTVFGVLKGQMKCCSPTRVVLYPVQMHCCSLLPSAAGGMALLILAPPREPNCRPTAGPGSVLSPQPSVTSCAGLGSTSDPREAS